MRTLDFDFYLPNALIAQYPTKNRGESRLLRVDANSASLVDDVFSNLIQHLSEKDVIVFNDTRVIKARLFGVKATGGAIELMVERVLSEHEALAHIRASRAPKAGAKLILENQLAVEVLGRQDDLFHVRFLSDASIYDLLEQHGHLPLPPYITHQADTSDETRYQTVYAKHAGAVAAPTAGLHFDDAMLQAIQRKGASIAYVTLHVGAGTFQPVKVEHIHEHKMHSERYQISAETVGMIETAKKNGGKVIAVGTTALRALESAALTGKLSAGAGDTSIFITPGFTFKVVDKLLTNFHLPKSTLMMLVSAFAGYQAIKEAYAHAIEQEYRFFSYGDAMLLTRADSFLGDVER
jgi:S-adenosylmethionine:tRNA ribosyltransferase-isomerase